MGWNKERNGKNEKQGQVKTKNVSNLDVCDMLRSFTGYLKELFTQYRIFDICEEWNVI